jgi:hypothetical protein
VDAGKLLIPFLKPEVDRRSSSMSAKSELRTLPPPTWYSSFPLPKVGEMSSPRHSEAVGGNPVVNGAP